MSWLALVAAWGSAFGAGPDPVLVHEQGLVADAAAAVAEARREGARASTVAELMAAYRVEAERLATMQPVSDAEPTTGANEAALLRLGSATVRGIDDPAARAVVEAWLGPLPARVELLSEALRASGPSELTLSIAADVESQAVAVKMTATFDASRADSAARDATTQAAALRASSSPFEQSGLATAVQLRTLTEAATNAATRANGLRALATQAAALRDAAHTLLEQR